MIKNPVLLLSIVAYLFVGNVKAGSNEENGGWEINQYADGAILISALHVYGLDASRGLIPTFMVNYGSDQHCFFSFGITVSKADLP